MNRRPSSLAHALLVSMIALLGATLLLTAPASGAEYVSVKKDGVNIRSGPTTDQEILWEVFKSFPLKVVQRKKDWAEVVDFENDTGWIYAPLLSKQKTVIVKVETANMRGGAGRDFPIIATVKQGVVFKPIGRQGDWVKVSYKDDITGWIFHNLLWPNTK